MEDIICYANGLDLVSNNVIKSLKQVSKYYYENTYYSHIYITKWNKNMQLLSNFKIKNLYVNDKNTDIKHLIYLEKLHLFCINPLLTCFNLTNLKSLLIDDYKCNIITDDMSEAIKKMINLESLYVYEIDYKLPIKYLTNLKCLIY